MKKNQSKMKILFIIIIIFLFNIKTYSQIETTNYDEKGEISNQVTLNRKIEFYITKVQEKEIIVGKNMDLEGQFIENFYFEIKARPSDNTYIVKMGEDLGQLSFDKGQNQIEVILCPLFKKNCTQFNAKSKIGLIVQQNIFFTLN